MDKIKLAERIEQQEPEEAKWIDQDNIEVDLMAASRTRKLKKIQGSSIVSGQEFSQRLKSAYQVQSGLSEDTMKKKYGWASRVKVESDIGSKSALADLLKSNIEIVYQPAEEGSSLKKFAIRSQRAVADQFKHKGVLKTLTFHPTMDIVATGGMDKRLKVLSLEQTQDRIKAKKMVGVFVKDLPIQSAHFLKEGREILLTGARKFFYTLDLEKNKLVKIGRVGTKEVADLKIFKSCASASGTYIAFVMEQSDLVVVLCGRTKHVLFTLKVEGGAKSAAFANDEGSLFVGSGRGKVYEFELRTFGVLRVWNDEGALQVSEIAAAPEQGYLSTGQSSGIVNLYDVRKEEPELIKTYKNLGTDITGLEFHHSGRALAFWSRWKKQAIRIAEIDEGKVVPNFPRIQDTLHFPMCAAFSHKGDLLGVGNDEGIAKFFKVSS